MQYLLEIEWDDPVGSAVSQVLSALPPDVEQTTRALPGGLSRSFIVVSAADRVRLDALARDIAGAGAAVRVAAGVEAP